MSATKERAKGVVDETVGKAKRAAGEALNKPALKIEGDIQEAKGDAEKAAAKAKR